MKLSVLATICALMVCAPASAATIQTFDFRLPSIQGFDTSQGYVMTADNGLEVSITAADGGDVVNFYRDPDGCGPNTVNTRLDWNDPSTGVIRSAFLRSDIGGAGGQVGFTFPTSVALVSMELVAFAGTCGFSYGIRIDFVQNLGSYVEPDCNQSTGENLLRFRKSVTFDFDPNDTGSIVDLDLLLAGNAFSLARLQVMGEAAKFPPKPVPEPGTLALLGLGLAGLGLSRRRRTN